LTLVAREVTHVPTDEPADARGTGRRDSKAGGSVPRRVLRGDRGARGRGLVFVCEHNSGRSQIAAALAHELSNGAVAVHSAGSHPTERIEPVVVEGMNEIGVDVRTEFPKPLTDEVVRAADVVVTLGCGDACPVYAGKRYEDWAVADPAGQPIEVVRRIRYDLHHHVAELLESLNVLLDERLSES
jgi:protein-tyrosine-phosphatase